MLISIFHTVFVRFGLFECLPSATMRYYRERETGSMCAYVLVYFGIVYMWSAEWLCQMLSPNDKHNQYLCSLLHTFYVQLFHLKCAHWNEDRDHWLCYDNWPSHSFSTLINSRGKWMGNAYHAIYWRVFIVIYA